MYFLDVTSLHSNKCWDSNIFKYNMKNGKKQGKEELWGSTNEKVRSTNWRLPRRYVSRNDMGVTKI